MTLSAELDATLAALDLDDTSRAAADLARLYAAEIDHARDVARFAAKVMAAVERGEDVDLYDQVRALRARLGERECLDRLGARLHALLAELHATPKARAGLPVAPAGGGALAKLRSVGT